jgi:hypothetical protein
MRLRREFTTNVRHADTRVARDRMKYRARGRILRVSVALPFVLLIWLGADLVLFNAVPTDGASVRRCR